MKPYDHRTRRGQAMIEYTVASAGILGVIGFAGLYELSGDPPLQSCAGLTPIECLGSVLRDNYHGYAYTVSLSEIPDTGEFQALIDDCESKTPGECDHLTRARDGWLAVKDKTPSQLADDLRAEAEQKAQETSGGLSGILGGLASVFGL